MTTRVGNNLIMIAALIASVGFLYFSVLTKLGSDWWSDENYSHGLLVPFVIGFIVSREWGPLKAVAGNGATALGSFAVGAALLLLLAGTLGAELFTQRISLVMMLVGLIVLLFGTRVLTLLAVPFTLLLLAIPIPQIIFNRIAMPLQTYASQLAVWGIRLFDVPTVRKGNVIDILPKGGIQSISLEVVEACSGIRSLMTLVTLALVLAYVTRRDTADVRGNFSTRDFWRAVILMILAIPIAVVTNAARVTATGIATYHYGKQATEATFHDVSGWLVYVAALALLIGANYILRKTFAQRPPRPEPALSALESVSAQRPKRIERRVFILIPALIISGLAVNWFAQRAEIVPERRPLSQLSPKLGDWSQRGSEIKFDAGVEKVLRTTDYTMREYTDPTGRIANVYVGYYATQRTGATYHSPQNCLPGAGWQLKEPQTVDITTADGRSFHANRYIIENGVYREVMIYWYQGRGRVQASEYHDKLNTILDSVTRRRTDGAMIRVMTSVGDDEAASLTAAADLAARLADELSPFIPE